MAEQAQPTTQDVIAVAEFRAALRHFLRQSERVARQSGLTPQRYTLLLMIKGSPDGGEQSTVTELSERMQLAQSTVTELVRRAEEAGLIEREQSQRDARVAHLRLTSEGERRLMRSFTELAKERAQLARGVRQPRRRRHRELAPPKQIPAGARDEDAGRRTLPAPRRAHGALRRNRRGRGIARGRVARPRGARGRARARSPRRARAAHASASRRVCEGSRAVSNSWSAAAAAGSSGASWSTTSTCPPGRVTRASSATTRSGCAT